ncbi:MAG: hypothetical protein QOE92_1424, partial [Chloroflexota bacterium]|nr:hypothetical protein [Chloroflexota bacterium]
MADTGEEPQAQKDLDDLIARFEDDMRRAMSSPWMIT